MHGAPFYTCSVYIHIWDMRAFPAMDRALYKGEEGQSVLSLRLSDRGTGVIPSLLAH